MKPENKPEEPNLSAGNLFRLLLENSPAHVFIKDDKLRPIFLSKNFESLFGLPINQMIGQDMHSFLPAEIANRMTDDDKKVFESKAPYTVDEVVSGRHYTTLKFPILKDGVPLYLAGIAIDTTNKQEDAEKASLHIKSLESLIHILRVKVESVQQFLDYALDEAIKLTNSKIGYIYYYDEDTKEFTLNTWSKSVMNQCAITNPQTKYHLEKTGVWGEAVRQRTAIVLNDYEAEHPLKKGCPHGHAPLKKFLTVPVFNQDKIVAVVGVANKETDYTQTDILQLTILMDMVWKQTDRMQAEETIQLLKQSIEVLSEGAYWIDRSNCFVYVNDAGCKAIGYTKEEVVGQHISLVNKKTTNDSMDSVWKTLEQKGFSITESTHHRKDGSEFPVEIRSNYVQHAGKEYICGLAIDISEKKKTEETIINAQKLDSLGILAGGIAHDFNNLLGGIFGYIDMGIESSIDPKVTKYLSKAMNAIERARSLTQQLLTFAKGGEPIKQIDNLFPYIYEIVQFSLSGSNVACKFDVSPDLFPCNYDRNQIGQVIDNLVINAKQTMQQGGHIEVTAKNIVLESVNQYSLSAGNYIILSIQDFGGGISKDHLPHIFDPFFTTKAGGHGLGLSTCYSIIHRHGGCIDVVSELDKGSTFSILLPSVTTDVLTVNSKNTEAFVGNGTIIIMDDDPSLREVIGEMLMSLNYSVIYTENGLEAIQKYSESVKSNITITAMIFDLTIPGGMGGKEAIGHIRKLSSLVPVFVSSGYAEDPVMANPSKYGFTASICKPFKKSDLMEILKQYLPK